MDAASLYAKLRSHTAAQLGFDMEKLTPSQAAKLDTICGLKLEADRIATAQLRGEQIDPKQLLMVGEALESALKPAEVVATNGGRAAEAKEKFLALINNTIAAADYERELKLVEASEREEKVMQLEAFGSMPVPVPQVVATPAVSGDATVVPLRAKKAPEPQPSWMHAVEFEPGPTRPRWDTPRYEY